MPYKIYCVQLHVDQYLLTGAKQVPDCISESLSNNPQIDAIITTGETSPTHVSLISQSVSGSFETHAIAAAIDAIGITPMCIATSTHPGVTFFLQDHDDCGTPVATNTHRSLLISSGAVVPRSLTVSHQGNATLSVDVVAAKESGNDAIVISDAATLPALTLGGLRWTIGKMTVGGVALSDYTSMTIDFGNTVTTRGTQSSIWDQYIEVSHHAPTITITGVDPAWFKASGGIPIAGLACTHANTIIYLRQRDSTATGFVADGTATHIQFTAKGIAVIQQPMSGGSGKFTDTSLIIRCIKDAVNDPIEYDTTAAIT
jgi:hypothetical protein